jgi:hypothetical protein
MSQTTRSLLLALALALTAARSAGPWKSGAGPGRLGRS